MPSHFIGIFSLGPSILFYFFRGSTPLATDEGVVVVVAVVVAVVVVVVVVVVVLVVVVV